MPRSGRPVRFVAEAPEPTAGQRDELTVHLDPAWTAPPGADGSAVALRPFARRALERHDPLAEAMQLVDAFAAATGVDDALTLGDVTLWPRRRLVAWRRVHDLILWRDILGAIEIEPGVIVRGADRAPPELRDLLPLLGADLGAAASPAPGDAGTPKRQRRPDRPLLARTLGTIRRRIRPASPAPMDAQQAKLADWFGDPRRRPILVLSDATVHQTVDTADGPIREDPFLGPIVERLGGTSFAPVTLALERDATTSGLTERRVTRSILGKYADSQQDAAAGAHLANRAAERLRDARAVVEIDGVDVGSLLLEAEREFARDAIGGWVAARARIQRFLETHRPAAILMINEYSRPEWLAAARAVGIPTAAVQHGIIHPRHAGYVLPERSPALVLADRTYVFGPYERRLLTSGIYRESEVVVGGAPRLDLLRVGDADDDRDMDRAAVRSAVGAEVGERLIVFSSTNNGEVRRLVVAPALEAVLDRPLPGVRLVIKLHPAEEPHDLYARLAAGISAAGGFDPPPISVVRDIDLFRLLRGADAHLGVHSTVLTDAVVAGVRNLVVVGFPGSDALEYVGSGVARPIRDGGDLLAALEVPDAPGMSAAREAFLADHFAPGDAADRIASDLAAWLDS